MNKKFSTLLTFGLLVGGSLVSVANAQQSNVTLYIGDPAKPATATEKFEKGLYYVVADKDDNSQPSKDDLVMGITVDAANKDHGIVATPTMVLPTAGTDGSFDLTVSLDGVDVNNYLWTVEEKRNATTNAFYYTLVNKATGRQLLVDASGDLIDDYFSTTGANGEFVFGDGTNKTAAYYQGGYVLTTETAVGTTAANGFALTAGTITGPTAAGSKICLFKQGNVPVSASDLNDAAKGAFTLKYKDATNNPFTGALKAFEVSGTGAASGTYFATSWPKALDGKDAIDLATPADLAAFKNCTFIAADPKSNYLINDLALASGEGFGFTNVKGSMLVASAIAVDDMKKGRILSNNAAFKVVYKQGNDGNYQLSLASATFLNKKKDGKVTATDLIIVALNDQQGKYVTTAKETNDNFGSYTTTCTIDAANLMTVDKLLSTDKASVFNIKFISKTAGDKDATVSEYNKYLGVNGATEVLFAQGSDFVNLDAPENQWIIVDADKDANSFTFQNRDLADQKFTVQLVKIAGKDNQYKVIDGTAETFNYAWVNKDSKEYETSPSAADLNGTTIELTGAIVNPTAGFVTDELDNSGLMKFVATSSNPLIADKLYLGKGTTAPTLAMHKDVADTYLWTVVKSEVKPFVAYNDYAYYNATDKKVEYKLNGDTIKVSLFSFKQYGVDKTYLDVDASANTLQTAECEDAEDAQLFLIKANKNGTYSLIEVKDGDTEYRDVVDASTAETFSVNGTDATVDNDANGVSVFYDYTADYALTIEPEELTPSLKHEPNYVAMNASNRGYVAMDSTLYEGIIAPVSTLKSAYNAEQLTFKLDTADTDAIVPAFYISHKGNFMYNAKDSADYYNNGTASAEGNRNYLLKDGENEYAKAIFRAAKLVASDTLATTVGGKDAAVTVNKTKETLGGLNNFKFNIVQQTKESEGEYVIKSVNDREYLFNLNGFLGFTADAAKALVVNVEQSEAPVANESIEAASSVKVIAGNGVVTVIGAQGKKVTISNVLGQTIASTVVSSDNATIAVSAGVVFVSVEGEAAVKAIVK